MRIYCLLFAFLITVIACQNTASSTAMKQLDLLQYGIPITIMAPDSVLVKSGKLMFSQDVTIKGEEPGFDIQIFAYDASTTDVGAVKKEHLEEVQNNPYFSKIVQDDPDGFLYEIALDSTSLNYGFKHIRLQGDKEYIFQNGMVGSFTQAEAAAMYQAVQKKK